ncbi:MAG TPA: GNAT family N-acetyltransferase [Candidatus Wirthbacteria bacterium]|nr:GNAT family N-acetyltransferase [Candidatus Wirthbacteria bacterium]
MWTKKPLTSPPMSITNRPFDPASPDFEQMCQFIVSQHAQNQHFYSWHLGRLMDWRYNQHNQTKQNADNFVRLTHLWQMANELAGFALSEDFDDHFYLFASNQHQDLYPQMLNWVQSSWDKVYPTLTTWTVENELSLKQALTDAGFEPNNQIEKTRVFETINYLNYQMPDLDLTLQSLTQNRDYAEQAKLRSDAWPHQRPRKTNLLIRAQTRLAPIYRADFDFVLVDANGRQISGAEAFIDWTNQTAEIERVCTLREYQNQGYAKIVILSCLKKLAQAGIPTAYITGGREQTIYLYGNLGHSQEVNRQEWEKTRD